jgi:probable Rubsico expression protein CbbX
VRITQGTFSYLPDLTDAEISAQLRYAIGQGWAVAVEFTDDPHPRNNLWEMWGLPMFDIADAAAGLAEIRACRVAYPNHYVLVSAYDASHGRQTTALSFIVGRPPELIDLGAMRKESAVADVLDRLDAELIGLEPVKTRVREIAALLLVDRLRGRFGLRSSRPTLHMCFTGSPGTGKTTVALRMAEILRGLGYLRQGHLVSVTRDDLVGEYVGHTAPKTKMVLSRAMGGVLLIDEAYYLYRADSERDYGPEAIEILLQVMEANRDDLVVILAGYRDRMDSFFASNPGMASRIAHHIDFPDFTADELVRIAELMAAQENHRFSPEARQAFRDYLDRRMAQPRFANARSVRNAIDRMRLRQANRLVAAGALVGKDDLVRLEPDDILLSRVFG